MSGAKERGIPFNLTIQEALNQFKSQNGRCALSGIIITLTGYTLNGVRSRCTASLDRVENNRGYSANNIQWLHKDINVMKNVHEQNYFVALCHAVSDHTPCPSAAYDFSKSRYKTVGRKR
jgi:hypothetical protein